MPRPPATEVMHNVREIIAGTPDGALMPMSISEMIRILRE